jgi:simple sugar transport system ATP-binding protein
MREISLHEISKSFPGILAVNHVSLDFHTGEIHALLGENGAGKSTLMHVLSGLYRPDGGEIRIDGQPSVFASPRAALAAGIAMVHQHFMLVPTLTVAENILLAQPGKGRKLVRRDALSRQVRELADQYSIPVADPNAPVATLSVGAQQRVEILKALAAKARVLIFDEPTTVLTPGEVESLFRTLQRLKQEGHLIVLITHKIPEALAISDRLTVLRQGRLVTTRETASCTAQELASLMIGEAQLPRPSHPTPTLYPENTEHSGLPLLTLENVSTHSGRGEIALRNLSFTGHAGEVVGIVGVEGNGQRELVELLIGLRVPSQGTVWLREHLLTTPTPASLRAAGVALIPPDRQREGLALSLTIEENLLLNTHMLATIFPGLRLPPRVTRQFAHEQVALFGIRSPSPAQPVATLSGGNQQRVVIARELAGEPQVIVAANPSRGLDIGATRYVHHVLLERCRRGVGVVLISTDLDEILTLSTRVYALYQGRLLGPVESKVGREQLGRMMTGAWVPS